MQPSPSSRPARSWLSTRNLLIGIILVILAFATVHIVHGSGSKTSVKHRAHKVHSSVCTPVKHRHATCKQRARIRRHVRAKTGRRRAQPLPAYHATATEHYQMNVMHVLDRQRHVFDFVSYDTGIKSTGQLMSTCNDDLTNFSILTDEVDGIPHPGKWYSAVASFHRRVLQAYHDMASALEVCSTGAGNGDGTSVATSRQDLVAATRELHAVDDAAHRAWNHVHWMQRPHRR